MPEDEFFTTDGEAQRRLALLERFMADLQNAALGRGVKPLVSEQLADRVVKEVEAFRQWREQLGGVTAVWSWSDELEQWTRRANALRTELGAAKANVPAALVEWRATSPSTVFSGLGVIVAGVGLFWVLMNRRR